jgi:hypothetical protein
MKRVGLTLLLGVFLMGVSAKSAFAVPDLCKQFLDTYKDAAFIEDAKTAKCNICHFGKSKKNKNDFGVALSKLITKDDCKALKAESAEKLKEAIEAAFKKVEAEKSVSSITFGELMKTKLPGTAPEE